MDNERTSRFSFSPLSGMLFGQGTEIVFKNPSENLYLSELIWDLKPLIYFGLSLNYGPANSYIDSGLIYNASIKFGLPVRTGYIENRDWLNTTQHHLTHFSQHYAYSNSSALADLSLGYSFALFNRFTLKFYGEFSLMYFIWTAVDGFTQYPPPPWSTAPVWNSELPKENIYGVNIRYIQNWYIFSPVISLETRVRSNISLEANFSYSPLILCFARDDHFQRNIIFYDILLYGNYYNAGSSLKILLADNLEFSLVLSYRNIEGTRGDNYVEENNSTTLYRNIGGALYSALDMSMKFQIRL